MTFEEYFKEWLSKQTPHIQNNWRTRESPLSDIAKAEVRDQVYKEYKSFNGGINET